MFRERYSPWILGAGILASATLSWFLRSPAAGTLLGVFSIGMLIPLPSMKDGLQVGALFGGIAGAVAEAVLFSPERGIWRTIIATGYGATLGSLWVVIATLGWRVWQRIADRRATHKTPPTGSRKDP